MCYRDGPFCTLHFYKFATQNFVKLRTAVFLVDRRLGAGGSSRRLEKPVSQKLPVFAMRCEDDFVHGRA